MGPKRLLPAGKNGVCEDGVRLAIDPRNDNLIDGEDVLLPKEVQDLTFEARVNSTNSGLGTLFVGRGKTIYINGSKADQV